MVFDPRATPASLIVVFCQSYPDVIPVDLLNYTISLTSFDDVHAIPFHKFDCPNGAPSCSTHSECLIGHPPTATHARHTLTHRAIETLLLIEMI